jgi:hypothetical protein
LLGQGALGTQKNDRCPFFADQFRVGPFATLVIGELEGSQRFANRYDRALLPANLVGEHRDDADGMYDEGDSYPSDGCCSHALILVGFDAQWGTMGPGKPRF